MKSVFILVFYTLWIITATFSKAGDSNKKQYWRTRNIRGSDYGVEHNLKYHRLNANNVQHNEPRILFDWNSNSKLNDRGSNQISDNDFLKMTDESNGQRNQNNVWWPWLNYEEWSKARKHNFLKMEVTHSEITLKQPTSNKPKRNRNKNNVNNVGKKNNKKRKRKKIKHHSKNDEVRNEISRAERRKSFDSENYKQSGKNDVSGNQRHRLVPEEKRFFNVVDNNEINNEIQPRYNDYYSPIPAADSRIATTLVGRIRQNEKFSHFFRDFTKRNFSEDRNNCLINNGGCKELCINIPGFFKCICPDGFRVNSNKCVDINECLLWNGHGPCEGRCINTWGSYRCSCDNIDGTRLASDGHTCEDIDECKEHISGCSHECVNTVGTAFCLCPQMLRY